MNALGLVRILAWRRIVDRPVRSCLTAAGVAVGVAFLFSMLSLNAQLASTVHGTAALLDGPRLLQVTPAAPGGLPQELAAQLASDDRLEAAAPVILTRSTASKGEREAGIFVLGATPEDIGPFTPEDQLGTLEQAQVQPAGAPVILSRRLADRLHVTAGDQISLHPSTGTTDAAVLAVMSSSQLDRVNGGMVAGMLLGNAQELFGRPGRVDQILLLAKPDTNMDALRRDIAEVIDGVGVVDTPGDAKGAASANFAFAQLFTSMMGMFAVLAAGFLVFHTLSMTAAERRTEIALARSLGSSRRQLLLVTLTEAGFLGGAGAAVGLVLGGLLARLVVPFAGYMYDEISPVDVPADVVLNPRMAALAALAGIACAVLGAVVPARAAARATPIDAFRPAGTYEWKDPTRPTRRLAVVAAGAVLFIGGVVLSHREMDINNPLTALPLGAVYLGALLLVPAAIPFVVTAATTLLNRRSTTIGRLAGDALRANPRRTVVNVSALLIPVTILIAVNTAFSSSFGPIGRLARGTVGAPLNVDADSYIGGTMAIVAPQPLASADQGVLEDVPGVRAVLPYENAYIRLPDSTAGIVYAIPLAAAARAGVADMVRFPDLSDDAAAFTRHLVAGEIAASRFAARSLDLEIGDHVTLPTPDGPRDFTVGALYDDWAFHGTFAVDLDTYRAIWADDSAHRFAIVPADGTSLDDLRHRLDAAVTDAGMPAQVMTRGQAIADLEAATTIVLPLSRGMSIASLVLAALALANAAFTSVTERRWTFALQQTLGMTRREITRSLALEAIVVGLIGAIGAAIVGVGLGSVLIGVLGSQVALSLSPSIPWAWVAISMVLGIAVALASTSYPRRVAKRLTIVEALRFE